jgi:hypothetical protein
MDDELDHALGQLAARARLRDGQALAQANFFLLRVLLKYLVIEGPMGVDRLKAVLDGARESADKSGYSEAAKILEELSEDLLHGKHND